MSTTKNRKLKPEVAAELRICHRRSWPCWLTAEEVAEMLRVDIGTVYSLARQNILPHVKIGRIYRFDRDGMFWQARESYRCWTGGSYYSVDEFELAVRAFLAKGEG